jgi:hypothetical protein
MLPDSPYRTERLGKCDRTTPRTCSIGFGDVSQVALWGLSKTSDELEKKVAELEKSVHEIKIMSRE